MDSDALRVLRALRAAACREVDRCTSKKGRERSQFESGYITAMGKVVALIDQMMDASPERRQPGPPDEDDRKNSGLLAED